MKKEKVVAWKKGGIKRPRVIHASQDPYHSNMVYSELFGWCAQFSPFHALLSPLKKQKSAKDSLSYQAFAGHSDGEFSCPGFGVITNFIYRYTRKQNPYGVKIQIFL